MLAQVVRRLLIAIPTILAIITAAFFLIHAAPGGPFDRERQVPAEIERRLLAEYNLDQPVPVQLWRYLGNLVQGDLGPSMKYKDKDVADIIAEGLPASAILGISAMTLALLLGSGFGILAALKQNKAQDYTVMGFAVLGVCLPPLVMGPVLALVFGVNLQWLPSVGLHRDEFGIRFLILPIITLALPQIAIISRLMRASMIEALRSNAIRTARAKGLPESQVILRHALPVALLPVVSYLGPAIAGVLTGSFVVENVFLLPGVGQQLVLAAQTRDYPLVLGVVIVYATLIIFLNLAADILYGVLDPRARRA
ncbi:MAG: ABC transporter permease subunit [Terricaulis sp.]